MDMVYSTLCSSEFSERGWVSSKSGLCHYYANSIHFSCEYKCIFDKCIMLIFFIRDGRLCDIKILPFKFCEASG